jgi:uncharacterized protein (TIGR02996 family)
MGLFDFLRRRRKPAEALGAREPGGRGLIVFVNAGTGEGGLVLEDGREAVFEGSACLGFRPAARMRVDVAELRPRRQGGGWRASVLRWSGERAPDDPPPAEPPARTPREASPTIDEPRHPELEAALLADPDDLESVLVLGDWLQARGHPRGELIALQHRLELHPEDAETARAAKAHVERHAAALLGPLASCGEAVTLEWRRGFIRSARIAGGDPDRATAGEVELDLLRHPSARLLRELRVGLVSFEGEDTLDVSIEGLVEAGVRPLLRKLVIGDFVYPDECEMSWTSIAAAHRLWPLYPGLQELELQAGAMELGEIVLPRLRSFELRTGGLSRASLRAIGAARWPELERLVVWFGDPNYGAEPTAEDLPPLLEAAARLPRLRHLGLMNCEFTDGAIGALVDAAVLPRLEVLDLSLGTLSDAGAAELRRERERLAHLRRLDVGQSFLSEEGVGRVQGICAEVVTARQRGDGEHRYVSVGE